MQTLYTHFVIKLFAKSSPTDGFQYDLMILGSGLLLRAIM